MARLEAEHARMQQLLQHKQQVEPEEAEQQQQQQREEEEEKERALHAARKGASLSLSLSQECVQPSACNPASPGLQPSPGPHSSPGALSSAHSSPAGKI